MNNLAALGYNIQALFSQVATINSKLVDIENQILKTPLNTGNDNNKNADLEFLKQKGVYWDTKINEQEKQIKKLIAELAECKVVAAQPAIVATVQAPVPVPAPAVIPAPVQEHVAVAAPVQEQVSVDSPAAPLPEDDLVITMKPKGGRKKKGSA